MSPAESTPQSKSTGPRTPAGKAKSSLNAMRHGLTGRVVVLPGEDMNVYKSFCTELMADLAPETALERQYAQTFCDTQWRLNRARSYEDNLIALAHIEQSNLPDVDHAELRDALIAAKVFRENSQAFVNLSLYEQRLQRQQKEALRQLQELQAQRKAERQARLDEAVALRNLYKAKGHAFEPAEHQFVFSNAEIEREAHRQNRRADAQTLRSHGPSLVKQAA